MVWKSGVSWELLQRTVEFHVPKCDTLPRGSSLAWKAQPSGMYSRTPGKEKKEMYGYNVSHRLHLFGLNS